MDYETLKEHQIDIENHAQMTKKPDKQFEFSHEAIKKRDKND